MLNLVSGVFAGYALFATTGVLEALFAGGPTPERVRAALPSLILVAVADGGAVRRSRSAAGWAQARLEPQVDQVVEVRLYDLTTQVELAAFDDPDFHDRLQRARDRGSRGAGAGEHVINFVTAFAGIGAAAVVVGRAAARAARVLLSRAAARRVGGGAVGADRVRDQVRAGRLPTGGSTSWRT